MWCFWRSSQSRSDPWKPGVSLSEQIVTLWTFQRLRVARMMSSCPMHDGRPMGSKPSDRAAVASVGPSQITTSSPSMWTVGRNTPAFDPSMAFFWPDSDRVRMPVILPSPSYIGKASIPQSTTAPIKAMPMQRHLYPPDWRDISLRVRQAAGWKCRFCGAENRKPHPVTGSMVVLTVAHLDHDPANNTDENLAALCQRCHLRHDAEQHRISASKTRNIMPNQLEMST